MVEGNEKGKQARRYFIECEKAAQQIAKPLTQMEALLQSVQMLAEQDKCIGQVRIAMNESNEPVFCLADVAKALGYSRPADAVSQHCKGVAILPTPTVNQYGTTVMQEMKYGKESEVYRLTMKSKLPDAEKFQDWVCDEVLPSIRKHGMYDTEGIMIGKIFSL